MPTLIWISGANEPLEIEEDLDTLGHDVWVTAKWKGQEIKIRWTAITAYSVVGPE
jgi:hypothetical protein